jgi:hypothetical protein
MLNSIFLTRKQFDKQVEIFKGLSTEIFYRILEYSEEEIDNWLVDYSMKKKDIEEAIHGIYLELIYLEGDLFNIKIWHEMNVAPMKGYIEYWFNKSIEKLTKEGKETIDTVPITVNEENKRKNQASEDTRDHHSKFMLITYCFLYHFFHPITHLL